MSPFSLRPSHSVSSRHSTHSPAPPPPNYAYATPGPHTSTTPGFRGSQAPPGPPPGADPQLWQWFQSVDTDYSGAITAEELRRALVNGDWSSFDIDTVKMLMGIFDTDRSGTINFNEFTGLWKYVNDWQGVFAHFDQDRSGSIDGQELQRAMRNFGYNLSPQILSLVEQKYAPPNEYGQSQGITFDRFVRACVFVKTLTESFQRVDTDRDGWIQVSYDQFMNMVLAAP